MNDWITVDRDINNGISNIKFALLITRDADNLMQARALSAQVANHDGAVWFFSVTDSDAVADICQNPAVQLCYGDGVTKRFIASSGTATLSSDRQMMEQLWNPACAAVFPRGLADPLLILLRIEVQELDLWDADKSTVDRMQMPLRTNPGSNTRNVAEIRH